MLLKPDITDTVKLSESIENVYKLTVVC